MSKGLPRDCAMPNANGDKCNAPTRHLITVEAGVYPVCGVHLPILRTALVAAEVDVLLEEARRPIRQRAS